MAITFFKKNFNFIFLFFAFCALTLFLSTGNPSAHAAAACNAQLTTPYADVSSPSSTEAFTGTRITFQVDLTGPYPYDSRLHVYNNSKDLNVEYGTAFLSGRMQITFHTVLKQDKNFININYQDPSGNSCAINYLAYTIPPPNLDFTINGYSAYNTEQYLTMDGPLIPNPSEPRIISLLPNTPVRLEWNTTNSSGNNRVTALTCGAYSSAVNSGNLATSIGWSGPKLVPFDFENITIHDIKQALFSLRCTYTCPTCIQDMDDYYAFPENTGFNSVIKEAVVYFEGIIGDPPTPDPTQKYTLKVVDDDHGNIIADNGNINCGNSQPTCTHDYALTDPLTVVWLDAAPVDGWKLTRLSSTSGPESCIIDTNTNKGTCSVEMNQNITITPSYTAINPLCTPLQTETKEIDCPTGQTGKITQQRISSCPGPNWSAWADLSRTCSTPVQIVASRAYRIIISWEERGVTRTQEYKSF